MPDKSPYGENTWEVSVSPLEYTGGNGTFTTKTYHGTTIVVDNRIVGRITSWNPQPFGREGSHVRELSNKTFGRPVDYVPGISTGYTISFTRVEVWNKETEIAMGFDNLWSDLADQTRPFTILEYLFQGSNPHIGWKYAGCWFTDRNEESITAEGDGKYVVNATLAYISRTRWM